MPFSVPAGVSRITSKDMVIDFQPAGLSDLESTAALPVYGTDQNCVATILQSGTTGNTWKLRINGYQTGVLAGDIDSPDLIIAIELLPNVASGDFTISGIATEGSGTHLITAASLMLNEFVLFEIQEEDVLGDAVLAYTSFGSKSYRLSAELSSFSFSEDQETTDATAINETARIHLPTVRDMTWEAMLYEALQTWRHLLTPGMAGWLTIYEQGVGAAKRYFAFETLFTSAAISAEQFEKIEIELSGRRQGDWIIQPGSYQP